MNIENLNNIINQLDLIDIIKHSTQQEQNTYSFQLYVKYSPRENVFSPIKKFQQIQKDGNK